MTEDETNNKQQIQAAVRATFSTTLVPTDIELATTIEMPSSPLAEHDENLVEAKNEIAKEPSWVEQLESLVAAGHEVAQAPPLAESNENPVETKDEITKWVCEVKDSTARTLELSKRLDDLLARPIRWFHDNAVDKNTAVKSAPD